MLNVIMGGAIGAALRYSVQLLFGKPDGSGFPWATFLVNIAGCFVIGLLAALSLKFKFSEQTVLFLFTGILGSFTTFSTFSLEFVSLMKNNQYLNAFLYAGFSNIVGIGLCFAAYHLIRP